MATFVALYLLVWLAVALYVVRLGGHQRRLAARLEVLRQHVEDHKCATRSDRKAA